ncbi:cell division protein FtsQ/DivIB [Microcoleus sp. FACHB-672]|uniref:cell division protein FtsQ/DivIB n=1 Tax=Microcoleus sp. FACHB-672 TaxID=2692825 RepID=UPI001685ECD1|nr:FtsQ-type POTRA domain-containing protein [Microcoleus sp. FACHB-672]MBD2042903.1 FtsQ-type POTRA domain-containing protein [Microcoleus sp. FACHB-672]
MASFASVSQSELGRRRQELRRSRRVKFFQRCWQTVAVSCLAGGLMWVSTRPGWVIYEPEQVEIEGNQFLSAQTVRSLLPLDYPQSLMRLQPEAIAEKLESAAPIAQATVTRHLLPAGLTVRVKERYPVALSQLAAPAEVVANPKAVKETTDAPAVAPKPAPAVPTKVETASNLGVLDKNGWWTPLKSYTSFDRTLPLPTLKVIGNPDVYRSDWPPLYQELSRSPVKVSEIDWQDPTNLILKTELGTVHLGPYSSKFAAQLSALDKMRQLPKHPRYTQIAYIDLKNPQSPAIKLQQANVPAQTKAP